MESAILDDLKKRFLILEAFEIIWDKKYFNNNLSRFYGENLPNNCHKHLHCGELTGRSIFTDPERNKNHGHIAV